MKLDWLCSSERWSQAKQAMDFTVQLVEVCIYSALVSLLEILPDPYCALASELYFTWACEEFCHHHLSLNQRG